MNQERATKIAMELMKLGISHAGIVELLAEDFDEIERQLSYLPYRKARRPGAFLIEAVRKRYSPPKEVYYAKAEAEPTIPQGLDENSQLLPRPAPPGA